MVIFVELGFENLGFGTFNPCEVVIVLTFFYEFGIEAGGLCGMGKRSEINVEPVKLIAADAFILHLIEVLAIVAARLGIDFYALFVAAEVACPESCRRILILVFVDIADVGGIDDELAVKRGCCRCG